MSKQIVPFFPESELARGAVQTVADPAVKVIWSAATFSYLSCPSTSFYHHCDRRLLRIVMLNCLLYGSSAIELPGSATWPTPQCGQTNFFLSSLASGAAPTLSSSHLVAYPPGSRFTKLLILVSGLHVYGRVHHICFPPDCRDYRGTHPHGLPR